MRQENIAGENKKIFVLTDFNAYRSRRVGAMRRLLAHHLVRNIRLSNAAAITASMIANNVRKMSEDNSGFSMPPKRAKSLVVKRLKSLIPYAYQFAVGIALFLPGDGLQQRRLQNN